MLELAYSITKSKKETDIIKKAVNYINRNYTQNITLDTVCKVFSCTRSYMSHNFKKETGQGFREYLTSIRIRSAKLLLRYSDLNVTEISDSLGFCDSNYFSLVFKKYTGKSPTEYKKAKRQD